MTNTWNTLALERDGAVARLTLSRPEKLNAFSVEMWNEMGALGKELVADDGIRALVVSGAGRAFSSGIDTSVFTTPGTPFVTQPLARVLNAGARPDDASDPLVAAIGELQDAYTWLEEAPFATIASVRGYALGAGMQCMLACDIRVMARGTKTGLLEFKYGMLPDLGGTQRLTRLVGPAKAKELIFTGAQIDAEEAYRLGICERLVDDDVLEKEADALAHQIAAQPPLAVRGAKRAIDEGMRQATMREGLRLEAELQAVCLRSSDIREAMAAFVEQRTPVYKGE